MISFFNGINNTLQAEIILNSLAPERYGFNLELVIKKL